MIKIAAAIKDHLFDSFGKSTFCYSFADPTSGIDVSAAGTSQVLFSRRG
jgi:hypothetical protein